MAGTLAVLVGLLGFSVVVAAEGPGYSTVAQATTNPSADADFALTLNSTQNLINGQPIQFTVQRTAAGKAAGLGIWAANTGWCPSTAQLPVVAGMGGNSYSGGTFPVVNVGGSVGVLPCAANVNNNALVAPTAISPLKNTVPNQAGQPGDYGTLTGTALAETGTAPTTGPTATTPGPNLTCDSLNSCLFTVVVWTSNAADPNFNANDADSFHVLGVPVTFSPASAANSCDGTTANAPAANGPDRLGQLVTNWTVGACVAGVGGGQALTAGVYSGGSDASSLAAFASGQADLAYSAVGYGGAGSGFDPAEFNPPDPSRPYVAVPIAINAVVLAHDQTYKAPAVEGPVFQPFPQPLSITWDQMAQLLSNGGFQTGGPTWTGALGRGLTDQNPELTNDYLYGTTFFAVITNPIVVTSGTDATTLFATSFLHDAANAANLVSGPPNGQNGEIPSAPVKVVSNFGLPTLASPPYYVTPLTGSGLIAKALTPAGPNGNTEFALTNSYSAANLWGGLADFPLQSLDSVKSSTPTFVPPAEDNMVAAVTDMTAQPDGTLTPNPNAGPVNGVEPYPLTYVEYALAPTRPLLNANCTPNTQAQQNLANWLSYITGAGQQSLSPTSTTGLAPLTPALELQAEAAIAKIGKATPACMPATTTTPTTAPGTSTTTPSTSSTAGSSGASSTSGSGSSAPSAFSGPSVPFASQFLSSTAGAKSTGSGAGASTTPSTAKGTGPRATAMDLASFRSGQGAGWIFSIGGIVLLALLLPGLALVLSGRARAVTGLGSNRGETP
jgi:hypothetical protein